MSEYGLSEKICEAIQSHTIEECETGGYVCVECGESWDYDPYDADCDD